MNRLKCFREALGLSQYELAEATQVVPRWKIQLIEQGFWNPSKQEREALASVLGKSPSEVFPESGKAKQRSRKQDPNQTEFDF